MAILKKIDSNVTGLRYAEEVTLGVLPGSPTWRPLEPNSYADLGGDFKILARNPINSGRQRQKGVLVDLDAAGGFNQDFVFTEDFIDLLQGFFFADIREKGSVTALTNVDGATEAYQKTNGFGSFFPGSLAFAKGFAVAANNGLKRVTALTTFNDAIIVAENLTTEVPPAAAMVRKVGHQFGTTEASITNTGAALPTLNIANAKGTGVLTFAGVVTNNETVTIGETVYTFKTALTPAAFEVLIGVDQDTALTNLKDAINLTGTPGTQYGAATTIHPYVTGVADTTANTLTVTSKLAGSWVNALATTETMLNGSWGAATLTGGSGTFDGTVLIPGEFIYIGDDANALFSFATAANNGFARVRSSTFNTVTIDKTSATWVTDAGTGKTIRLYFGRVLKNELDTLIKRRSYNIERTLGAPDTSLPTSVQAEYLVGAVANELTMNFKTADKMTLDLSFVATDDTQSTVADGLKTGTRPTLTSADAFNSSNDFSRLRLTVLDPINANPTDLFAFLSEFTVAINNNVSPNKAIKVLGAFELTAGQFMVDGKATAYFSQVEATAAIRNNSDVSLDFALVKANVGFAVDMPLIALGGGKLNVEQDKEITLPLEMPAGEDRNFHHTLMMNFYDYLPNIAAS